MQIVPGVPVENIEFEVAAEKDMNFRRALVELPHGRATC
jgi:hypothetical protein